MFPLSYILRKPQNALRERAKKKLRSPRWDDVQRAFIQQNPECAACGGTSSLNVHHIKPFSKYPELELDTSNLITLCMSLKLCHFKIGHGSFFRAAVPNIVELARQVRLSPDDFKKIAEVARLSRIE